MIIITRWVYNQRFEVLKPGGGGGGGYFLVIGLWGCAAGCDRILMTGLTIMGLHFL